MATIEKVSPPPPPPPEEFVIRLTRDEAIHLSWALVRARDASYDITSDEQVVARTVEDLLDEAI